MHYLISNQHPSSHSHYNIPVFFYIYKIFVGIFCEIVTSNSKILPNLFFNGLYIAFKLFIRFRLSKIASIQCTHFRSRKVIFQLRQIHCAETRKKYVLTKPPSIIPFKLYVRFLYSTEIVYIEWAKRNIIKALILP